MDQQGGGVMARGLSGGHQALRDVEGDGGGNGGGAAGVTSFNGETGAVTGLTSLNGADGVVSYYPTVSAASLTQLAGIPATLAFGYDGGSLAWVETVGDFFGLRASTLTPDGITVINANSRSGFQWVRLNAPNPKWHARTTWYVDPASAVGTASDENDGGTSAAPLASWKELARRLKGAYLTGTVTVNAQSNAVSGDDAHFEIQGSGLFAIQGRTFSTTPVYSGTISGFTAQTDGPAADDNQLADSGLPTSFTSSGLLANGIICKRTSGTAAYWYVAKDLGSKTARVSTPCDVNGTGVLALANGDTYAAYNLTQLRNLTFPARDVTRVRITDCMVTPAQPNQSGRSFIRTWFAASTSWNGLNFFFNCAWDYAAATSGTSISGDGAPGVASLRFGMMRGTNNALVTVFGNVSAAQVLFQGCRIEVNSMAFLQVQGRISFFDVTEQFLLRANYWSAVLFYPVSAYGTVACIGGKGNTGKILWVYHWSKIVYHGGVVPVVDAISSDAAPLVVGITTSYATAALPVLDATKDIGIFASE